MTEKIGNFLWKNNFSTFSLSHQRDKSAYFHTILLAIKIAMILAVFIFFKVYNFSDLFEFILFAFFAFLLFIFISQLVGIYIKPTHNILKYNRSKNLFSIKVNYFKTTTIKVHEIDSLIIDQIKELVSGGNGGHAKVYRYMAIVYCKDIYGNKHEMFIVNPSGIIQKHEDETIYELNQVSTNICNKIGFILNLTTTIHPI
ncbi:conserved protein of unknown function [Tenacibaculum sp. 190130A14a]|uniref:Uncharacterized protein n=1 Tax=Tenacibaculum polynesiense TaxID=3137857 RepID=A0ABM9P6T6_9FLAO